MLTIALNRRPFSRRIQCFDPPIKRWRSKLMRRTILAFSLNLCVCVLVVGDDRALAPPPRAIPISELLRQLESEDFHEREIATKRLSSLKLNPPSELLAATRSENPEVRGRALRVLKAIRRNIGALRMSPDQRAVMGQVDLFVAATFAWDREPKDALPWEPALEMGQWLIKEAKMTGDRRPHNCPSSFPNFATYRALCNPRLTRVDGTYERQSSTVPEAIQAADYGGPGGFAYSIGIIRGSMEMKGAVQSSLLLANGNISTTAQVSDSILICDGDVNVGDFIANSIIVARGNITAKLGADTSVLMVGGKITLERQNKRLTGRDSFNVVREKLVQPLGITFFELSTVGVEVKAPDKAVQVSSVTEGKPFADAGVRVGDIITDVNGKKPESAESLRRLLRDALAIGDATVKLNRRGKTETVKVSLPE